MSLKTIEKYLLSKKQATLSTPFGPDVNTYKIMDKMFALTGTRNDAPQINLKCDPVDGEFLRSQYSSIIPGYHMNKKHWITVILDGDVPEEMLFSLIDQSYDLIVENLPKAAKKRLDNDIS